MINAVFASVTKRTNSTLVPSLTGGETIPISLKDPCSIMDPKVLITHSNPTSYNYMYIAMFNRYYFVNDWTSDHGMWIASCTVDVLASFKSSILARHEYVLRSASEFDGAVVDTAYPATVNRDFQRVPPHQTITSELEYFPFQQGLSYIVGITGCVTYEAGQSTDALREYSKSMVGSVSYYWLSRGELYALIKYLLSQDALQDMWNISDISDNLQKGIIDPLQYINTVVAVPFDRVLDNEFDATQGTATRHIYYGYFSIACTDLPDWDGHSAWVELYKPFVNHQMECSFRLNANHPYASTRGKYLNFSPYTEYQMTFEPFGNFVLDPKNFEDAVGLKCVIDFEGVTGIGTLKIHPYEMPEVGETPVVNPRRLIHYAQAQVGIPISIAQVKQDYVKRIGGDISGAMGMIASGAGLAGSIASGNIPGAIASGAGLVNSASSMIGNAIESMIPNASTKGTNGCLYTLFAMSPYLYISWTLPVDDDNAQLGRPLCKVKTLSTLSGYCQVRDADVAIAGATEGEMNAVRGLLNGGFFIE